ncbi:hypothetical protein BDV10DRAFT_181207 [Aspergillus recurvatus]
MPWQPVQCRWRSSIATPSRTESLACSELCAVDYESRGLVASLASVKNLSLSFSDRIINERGEDFGVTGASADEVDWDAPATGDFRDDGEVEAEACDGSTFTGLVRLVQLCSGLRELDLHHCKLEMNGYVLADLHQEWFLQRIAMTTLTTLERCVLRGMKPAAWQPTPLSSKAALPPPPLLYPNRERGLFSTEELLLTEGQPGEKPHTAVVGGGFTTVIAPDGRTLTEPVPTDGEGLIYTELDSDEIYRAKQRIDPLGHYSRPDLFTLNVTGEVRRHVEKEPEDGYQHVSRLPELEE